MTRPAQSVTPHTCVFPIIKATVFILTLFLFSIPPVKAQTAFAVTGPAVHVAPVIDRDAHCSIIYLGFVGALEPAGNRSSGVVQLREILEGSDFPDVCAKSFSPYAWTGGRDWLLKHFPAHTGALSAAELALAPKVILVGHSMGGWAMLSVARELRSREIPVELAIQVDSVGITDFTVPRNVRSASIFHANDILMFLTTKHVRLEDPAHTKLLADITVKNANHNSITRDPRIRALVLGEISFLRSHPPTAIRP